MAKTVVIDELQITIRIPTDSPETRVEEIRQILNCEDFMNRLRRAVRNVVRAHPELSVARVSLSR